MKEKTITKKLLKERIDAARGSIKPDLVLKDGNVINVFTGGINITDVAIHADVIVGLGQYEGRVNIEAKNKFIIPGLIDGHIHIESTLLAPSEFARAVLPCGATTVIADPHEIANVMGAEGLEYMLEASSNLPVDLYYMFPSCVPATPFETAGASLDARAMKKFINHPRILGLGEVMNYPGVIAGNDMVLDKLIAFSGRVIDGHAPLVTGKNLNAYAVTGISSDHECSMMKEAREQVSAGMHLMIREGTQAKNMRDLIGFVTSYNNSRCSLVTDDLHPHDLLRMGHLNHLIDLAIELGLDPVTAIKMASFNTAQHFGLNNLGAIAPGYQADIVILSSIKPVRVEKVIKRGRFVFDSGKILAHIPMPDVSDRLRRMNVAPYNENALRVKNEGKKIRVIGLIPEQVLTRSLVMEPTVKDGFIVPDVKSDILKVAVIERHKATGNVGLGFVHGLGIESGAIASSVAHDSHNIIAAGTNDTDIYVAARAVEKMRGGLAAVKNGKVIASLALPVAGLMSDNPLKKVAASWEKLRSVAKDLGSLHREPFMALSFLALPVIPELKITDRGLFDVNAFKPTDLFV
jgi:adenine deaminase